MTLMLLFIGLWSALLLMASLFIASAAMSFYWFTVPFIAFTASCVVLCCAGIAVRAVRKTVFWIVAPLHAALIFPFGFAVGLWPGGDDGSGLLWLFVIGGGSVIALFLAVFLMGSIKPSNL